MIGSVENFIQSQYVEMLSFTQENPEHEALYADIKHPMLRTILSTIHHDLIILFRKMNERLPTGEYEAHYWAEESREVFKILDIIESLKYGLRNTEYAISIDPYYEGIFADIRNWISTSGGSSIPPHHDKITIYYTDPMFTSVSSITLPEKGMPKKADLKLIGEGSYAQVFKYKDEFYNRMFVLKRAKKELGSKELARFKREYEIMDSLRSPYIAEVYHFYEDRNEYIMEYMDTTLAKYISDHNTKLDINDRKRLVYQVIKAFEYLHSKRLLHRDISPNNILLKFYDDVIVVKVADFGLVHIVDSSFTTVNTEFKGWFNDPSLNVEGFANYSMEHEIYALTRIVLFIMTGKINASNITNNSLRLFVEKGLNTDKSKRYKSVKELEDAFKKIEF